VPEASTEECSWADGGYGDSNKQRLSSGAAATAAADTCATVARLVICGGWPQAAQGVLIHMQHCYSDAALDLVNFGSSSQKFA
jgi:hypothetical protein